MATARTLSADDRAAARTKLRAAWRRANPGKADEDMPEPLRATEPADPGAVPAAFAADAAPESGPTKTFLTRLRDLLKGKVSDDDWSDALKKARGHAGGKASAAKRKAQTASEVRAHAERHPDPVAGCEYCAYPAEPTEKMPKADARANYRPADAGEGVPEGRPGFVAGDACGKCRFYRWGACALVEGTIEADWVCDLYLDRPTTYLPSPSIYAMAEKGGAWGYFSELRSYAEAPEWFNVLPKPGSYTHPLYGTILVTAERNRRFKDNFDARVYQQDLPLTLDLEHDGKMSGAVGSIAELRVNDDGSVDARAEWTERGVTMLAEDRFRYFSPEWWDTWTDPTTGRAYQDVLIGGALTVRPFFKENALRPLVASEDGRLLSAPDEVPDGARPAPVIVLRPMSAAEAAGGARAMGEQDTRNGTPAQPAAAQLSEEQLREFTELKAKAAQFDELKATVDALTQANRAMQTETRRRRFTDIVLGRGDGGDGAVWSGPVDANVKHLERFADVYGEDSEEFRDLLAMKRAEAVRFKESGVFRSVGSDGAPAAPTGAAAEVHALAKAKVSADPKLSLAKATSQVYAERPDLYRREMAGE